MNDVSALGELLAARGVVVLSGAGLSTESGIPDYRGPTGAARTTSPMTYQLFVGDAAARQRYWARSYLGWRQIADARPNAGHYAVAELQRQGLLDGIITQNVDGLHQAAGALDVIELHGGLEQVVCLGCGVLEGRRSLDDRLRAANPDFRAVAAAINADGDVELPDEALQDFRVVGCRVCDDGLIKPDVVFFGENVPRPRVQACFDLVDNAESLLVLGSSLTVMSGLRFVRRAAANGTPVAIVNQGPTRGDELATLRIDAPLGELLSALAGQGGLAGLSARVG
ncbi:NAD-dependent protein deacetylase [Jatrophihabitans sp.]|uniref:NAD-dependent protein deacetylase n=1 Tax=Jatrophihabitans sp. TaxID=1932789 RepID=UPI0030C784CA|nr:NAD-dependent protein deacetylase [Jatrophihabitans sp.]